ncbi:TPA: phosphate starvation-inducible protein PhoH, partial [Streptococcus equi subsp. equi]|nr:phosphate starvation-inducible protein PhoH [Streptococcus equi subsp. equi]
SLKSSPNQLQHQTKAPDRPKTETGQSTSGLTTYEVIGELPKEDKS